MTPGTTERDLAAGLSPTQLVIGDVEGLDLVASLLRRWATVLDDGGRSLARVDVTGWRGQASQGFQAVLTLQPGRWAGAADAFVAAAVALETYAGCLGPARATAAQACTAYARYVDALATGAAVVGVGLPDARSPGAALDPSGAMSERFDVLRDLATASPPPSVTGPTVDGAQLAADAESLRRLAIALLESARAAVGAAAAVAADALRRACADAPAGQGFAESTIRPAPMLAAGHRLLDAAGLLPAIGSVADGLNAWWYLADDRPFDAGVSAAGILPIVGEAVIGGKLIKGALRDGDDVLEVAADAGRPVPVGPDAGPGWLATHEVSGSHTLARHVGLSVDELTARAAAGKSSDAASSFDNLRDAERSVAAAIDGGAGRINRMMHSSRRSTELEVDMGQPIGISVDAAGRISHPSIVRVILRKDSAFPDGYRILTAYPLKESP